MIPAIPEYAVGEVVRYVDRQGRLQTGVVLSIEAHWYSWTEGDDEPPSIFYTLRHPTYRGKRFHTSVSCIHGCAA